MVGDGRAVAFFLFSLYGSNCLSEPNSILHLPRRQCHRNVLTRVAHKEDALEAQLIECNGPPRMGGVSRGGRPTLPTTPFSGPIRASKRMGPDGIRKCAIARKLSMARTFLAFVVLSQPESCNSHGRHAFGGVVFFLFWADNDFRIWQDSQSKRRGYEDLTLLPDFTYRSGHKCGGAKAGPEALAIHGDPRSTIYSCFVRNIFA